MSNLEEKKRSTKDNEVKKKNVIALKKEVTNGNAKAVEETRNEASEEGIQSNGNFDGGANENLIVENTNNRDELVVRERVLSVGEVKVGGNIDIVAGNFVGDTFNYYHPSYENRTTVQDNDVVYPTSQLKGRLALGLKLADALQELEERSVMNRWLRRTFFQRILTRFLEKGSSGILYYDEGTAGWIGADLDNATNQLTEIESNILREEIITIDQQIALNQLSNRVNYQLARLHGRAVGYVRKATGAPQLANSTIDKIGYSDLKVVASSHNETIASFWRELKIKELTSEGFDFSSDAGVSSIKLLVEIENRNAEIQNLVLRDKRRNNVTTATVLTYIVVVIGLVSWLLWRVSNLPLNEQLNFEALELPLIGVPASVITWSLIGSFAAMIIRFNREPIYNFGVTVKWLLTRPVQGVILGAAFYIVLVSGLILFTQQAPGDSATNGLQYDIVLVLLFLVGFSDRFADAVFENLLVRFSNYSTQGENAPNGQKESTISVTGNS